MSQKKIRLVIQPYVFKTIKEVEEASKRFGYESYEFEAAKERMYSFLPPQVLCFGLKKDGSPDAEIIDPKTKVWTPIQVKVRRWNPHHQYGVEVYTFLAEGHPIKVEIDWGDPRYGSYHAYFESVRQSSLPEIDFYSLDPEAKDYKDPWVIDNLGIFQNPVAVMRKIMHMIAKRLRKGQTYKFAPSDEQRERIYKKICKKEGIRVEPGSTEGFFRITV